MEREKNGTAISRRAVTGFTVLALGAPAGTATAAPMTLRGTVFYRERIALPRTAMVEVKLLDVSLADAPARTIAEARIAAGPRNPIGYVLRFDRSQIVPRRTYALQARITDGDRLLFITTTRHAVFAGGRNETNIRVERVRGAPPAPARTAIVGRWLAEDIGGGGVIDRLQSVLEIAADGQVSGSGGCNRIAGRARIEGATVSFGQVASTRMACTPAAMNQEQKFLAALSEARGWRVDDLRRKLVLSDATGRPVMVLARM